MTCDALGAAIVVLAAVGLIVVTFLACAGVYIGLQMVGKGKKK